MDEKITIGVEFATRIVTMKDGKAVKAQIWDTAGQERYRGLTTAYYRGARGALLVYDVTKRETFRNVARWVRELRDHAPRDIVVILIGNKIDLVESNPNQCKVTYDEALEFAEEYGLLFCETSALSGFNVDLAFTTLIQNVYEQLLETQQQQQKEHQSSGNASNATPTVTLQPQSQQQKKSCC